MRQPFRSQISVPNPTVPARVAVLVGLGLMLSACFGGGEEQATSTPVAVAVDAGTESSAAVPRTGPERNGRADDAAAARAGEIDRSSQQDPGDGPTDPAPAPAPPTPTPAEPEPDQDPDAPADPDDPADPADPDTPGDPETPTPDEDADPEQPEQPEDETGGGEPEGGEPEDYDLLVFPVHAVVSQGCRDQADFPRIFQAGNPAVVLDTFDRTPLQTSVFSENIWVEIPGGPTDPQVELGPGQTALTTLLRATADRTVGHQVALSVFGFVSGGIEIRWQLQTRELGALTSPKFFPLNDTTSPCWVQLNTAVIETATP